MVSKVGISSSSSAASGHLPKDTQSCNMQMLQTNAQQSSPVNKQQDSLHDNRRVQVCVSSSSIASWWGLANTNLTDDAQQSSLVNKQ